MMNLLKRALKKSTATESLICELCGKERKIDSTIQISSKGITFVRAMGPKSHIAWKEIIQCDWNRKPNHLFLISRRGEMIHWEWNQKGEADPSKIFEFLKTHGSFEGNQTKEALGYFKAS